MIVDGQPYKFIADDLGISIKTVVFHVAEIKSRIGIRSLSGLIKWALLNGVARSPSVAATNSTVSIISQIETLLAQLKTHLP